MPAPVSDAFHPAYALTPNIGCEHRAKPVPPEPYRLVADIDAALEQQVLDVAQAERVAHVHHDHEPDHLRRRVETAERVGGFAHFPILPPPCPAGNFSLTTPGGELGLLCSAAQLRLKRWRFDGMLRYLGPRHCPGS